MISDKLSNGPCRHAERGSQQASMRLLSRVPEHLLRSLFADSPRWEERRTMKACG